MPGAGQLDRERRGAPMTDHLAAVIIPCGGQKLDRPAPAGELYVGSYHREARRAADAIVEHAGGRVLILSAKHGLLELDQVVEPYEQVMGKPGSISRMALTGQVMDLGLLRQHVVVLAGGAYRAAALSCWPFAYTPLDGSRGIGDHKARFKRWTEDPQAAFD